MSMMTQADIRNHYETDWKARSDAATEPAQLTYSSPVENAIVYPLYRQMITDLKIKATAGDILDVGSGAGRWIRFFLESYQPRSLTGADYTQASVDLLQKWFSSPPANTQLSFQRIDITQPNLDLNRRFDLINIANVLFHIPEEPLFNQALVNLARHLSPTGTIVTTEYLPRESVRTPWMLVRNRYTFEAAVRAAGLRIVAIKAFSIFSNDPMGIDGPDTATRLHFNKVRTMIRTLGSAADEKTSNFLVHFLTEIERSVLTFCRERIAEIDMPSQKLVFLAPL